MENDFRKLWLAAMIAVAVTMFVCIANAKGQAVKINKEKPRDLIATTTNLDAIIPGAGSPDTVCVLVWKGKNELEHQLNEFRDVHLFTQEVARNKNVTLYWRDVCLDTSYGEHQLYNVSVQVWPKDKVKNFKEDKTNRYIIEEVDLTKAQKDKIKQDKKNVQSLGNFRIKKEEKTIEGKK